LTNMSAPTISLINTEAMETIIADKFLYKIYSAEDVFL